MCSFLIFLKSLQGNKNIDNLNKLLKLRGPDYTNIIENNNYIFLHNLLQICGKMTLQPFIKDNIVCLFNGEIYNYQSFGNYESDGYCLIDLYLEHGQQFVTKLDGEFAIALFDFNKNEVIISGDIFATKPLFYAYQNGFIISSYRSIIANDFNIKDIKQIEPNTCLRFNLNGELLETLSLYQFCLKQKKTTFDDWINAFENAVRKRTETNKKIFITLSSGYDSGCLDLILKKLNITFTSYTILAREKIETIKKRLDYMKQYGKNNFIKLSEDEFAKSKIYVENNIDEIISPIQTQNKKKFPDGFVPHTNNTWAAYGLNHIFSLARKTDSIIYLSGQGPDEIMGDYGFNGKKFKHYSQLNGIFPKKLSSVFPWNNFFNGTMRAFISKEEGVASLHGIEGRYPYLDKAVVQEYLWLTPELKNGNYKSPLAHYMKINNYAFDKNVKIGFKCHQKLKK